MDLGLKGVGFEEAVSPIDSYYGSTYSQASDMRQVGY